MQAWKLEDWLKHHGVKGQKWGVRRGLRIRLNQAYGAIKTNHPSKKCLKDLGIMVQ